MDEVGLQECGRRQHLAAADRGAGSCIAEPFQSFPTDENESRSVKGTLVEDDHSIRLASKRCVEQLSREKPAWIRDHKEGGPEFRSLRLVHGDCVREFQDWIALPSVGRSQGPNPYSTPTLCRELHLQLGDLELLSATLELANDHPDFAVGYEPPRDR